MPEDHKATTQAEPESPRAAYQGIAERVGAVQPGVTLSEELFAFAEAVAQMSKSTDMPDRGSDS